MFAIRLEIDNYMITKGHKTTPKMGFVIYLSEYGTYTKNDYEQN